MCDVTLFSGGETFLHLFLEHVSTHREAMNICIQARLFTIAHSREVYTCHFKEHARVIPSHLPRRNACLSGGKTTCFSFSTIFWNWTPRATISSPSQDREE